MTNINNLKPVRTKEEARKRGKNGGKASGKARSKRKALKEELLLLLSTNNMQKRVSLALIKQAMAGNTKAFEVIRDTIGEKPSDKLEFTQEKPFEVKIEVVK